MSTEVSDSVRNRFVDGTSSTGVLGLFKVGLGRTGNSLSSDLLSCERVVTMVAVLDRALQ